VIHNRITLAHLSDLHLSGRNDRRALSLLAKMLRHFNAAGIDHLVISGDLSDVASPAGWAPVRDVLREHGFWHFDRATVLPGNHDLINLEEEMRIYNALNPFPENRRQALREKVAAFCGMFGELMAGGSGAVAGFPFVKVLHFSGISLAFVGVNSVWPWHRSDNPLGARGFVDPSQLRALLSPDVAAALKESVVVGLCHHALKVYGTSSPIDQAFDWTMEMINHAGYLAVMKKLGADVLLHGHFHRFQSYVIDGVPVINGGSFRYAPDRYSEMVLAPDGTFSQRFLSIS